MLLRIMQAIGFADENAGKDEDDSYPSKPEKNKTYLNKSGNQRNVSGSWETEDGNRVYDSYG